MQDYQSVRIGGVIFGIEDRFVAKVVPFRQPDAKVLTLGHVSGSFTDTEGYVVFILDLRQLFGLPQVSSSKTRIAIVQYDSLKIGLIVDADEGCVRLDRIGDLRPIPLDFWLDGAVPYIAGVVVGELPSRHPHQFFQLNVAKLAATESVLSA